MKKEPLPTPAQAAPVAVVPPSTPVPGGLSAGAVEGVRGWLGGAVSDAACLTDAQRIDLIGELESLKHAAAAAQAAVTVAFADSQDAAMQAQGVDRPKRARSIGSQVALARRESPWRGSRHLGLAQALVRELPNTYAALRDGRLSEWGATQVTRATACLSVEDRRAVDAVLAPRFGELGDVALGKVADSLAAELDPAAVAARARKAQGDRRVSVRPAPDTMAYLTALLPVAEAVACFAALKQAADAAGAEGEERSQGQVMADECVRRITGVDPHTEGVPVEIQLVMGEETMTGGADESARVSADGTPPVTIPARVARLLAMTGSMRDGVACSDAQEAWIRRLFTAPDGAVVASDPRRRRFTGALRDLVVARDRTCATPWCDAPIRHVDHITRVADGGATTAENGRGTCVACNAVKEAPGWHTETTTLPDGSRAVRITTPTGHTYVHRPPPALDGFRDTG